MPTYIIHADCVLSPSEQKYLKDLSVRLARNIQEFTFSDTDKYALSVVIPKICELIKE